MRMSRRLGPHLDNFLSHSFPDYDCLHAPDLALSEETWFALRSQGIIQEDFTMVGAYPDGFWAAARRDARRYVENFLGSFHDSSSPRREEDEDAATRLDVHGHIAFSVSLADMAVRSCPLGMAMLALPVFLYSLVRPNEQSGLERIDLFVRAVIQRFSVLTLMQSQWPILQALAAHGKAGPSVLTGKYAMPWTDFSVREQDFLQLEELQQESLTVSRDGRACSILQAAMKLGKRRWSEIAWESLLAGKHFICRLARSAPQVVLVSFVYGEALSALMPQYAHRLRSVFLDAVLLVAGDETSYRACQAHWWPSSRACIPGTPSYSMKYEVSALLQHAGLDVLYFDFDAVPLRDPRSHLREHHSSHDVAVFPGNAMYFYFRSTVAGRSLMRSVLEHLYRHGWFTADFWVLQSYVQGTTAPLPLATYVLPEAFPPKTRWGLLDANRFVCISAGWDCSRHEVRDVFFLHLHSDAGGYDGIVPLSPGTKMSNFSTLLSRNLSEARKLVLLYCNHAVPGLSSSFLHASWQASMGENVLSTIVNF